MAQVDPKVKEWFEGLRTEILAACTLAPRDEYNSGYNQGRMDAAGLARRYANGGGLFQIEKDSQ